MKKRLSFIVLALLFAGCTSEELECVGIECPDREAYCEDDYCVTQDSPLIVEPIVATDCSADAYPGTQAAMNLVDLSGGGTVQLPHGCLLFSTPLVANIGNAVGMTTSSMIIRGEGNGTLIVPDVGTSFDGMTGVARDLITVQGSGSVGASFELTDVAFIDKRMLGCAPYTSMVCPTPGYPAARTLVKMLGSHNEMAIRRVKVHSIWTTVAAFQWQNVEAVAEDIGIYSSYSGLVWFGSRGMLDFDQVHSADVSGIEFVDYTTVHTPLTPFGPAGDKHTSGSASYAAIYVHPRAGGLEGDDQPNSWHDFQRVFCDEGPFICFVSDGGTSTVTSGPTSTRAQFITLDGFDISSASLTGAGGIYIRNAEWVDILRSNIGYTPTHHYAIKLENIGRAYLHAVDTDVPPGATELVASSTVQLLEVDECRFETITSSATCTIVTDHGRATSTPSPCP